jgi:predicted small metal-binding protein
MLRRVRAVDCWCGYLVQGEDDDEVAKGLRTHLAEEHPDDERTDEEVRSRIAERGYEPPTGDPPWAY